ncbi:MAG: hypothetical protein A2W18_14055 [Candidatus Muproteobacteria bacterium RBG_16_60_9]|uniref:HTH merR-type domain-containing protein n=1 Tax=Candidatus Muproteobacteria bacterium RBG_16_60_9 TaxID=1817755 RepID=A0A1F6VAA7_9PROT|nr:MAG: hypothetical protein A2W18_14055 [Candidatus Muproteobacteria bacterium RBG_16_60_9]
MKTEQPARLLSIGEFAAATQLSLKALRLYDEQRLLRPAAVDAATGYRSYRGDQIPLGRLIRTLRDMDLPLAHIGEIVAADATRAETLVHQSAQEGNRRFARQQRAYQQALSLMREVAATEAPTIVELARPATAVLVRPFLAERVELIERFRSEVSVAQATLTISELVAAGAPYCLLIDPMSDEEGRLEAVIPILVPTTLPQGITIRQLPAASCAALSITFADASALDLTAALDTLFDWFDRRAYRATESPAVTFVSSAAGVRADIVWAFEPSTSSRPVAR